MALKRTLNLLDATAIGIGAIIGAGIFVVLGIAIGYAGSAVIFSIIIAGIVASFTAFSFAELGSAIPKEGGAYTYAYELLSPNVAFIIGFLWIFAQIVAGVAISIGFASYFAALFPILPVKVIAVIAALALTGLNLIGIKQSSTVNNVLVVVKVAILALFITFGLLNMHSQNFTGSSPNGIYGVLQGAGFIFFAYLGFGRIAALGEEVKQPQRTIPLAILLALGISVVIYILTAVTATGLVDYQTLAGSGSPIAVAAQATGNLTLVAAVSIGALVATTSVLLTNLIGLSRVSFSMARNGQLPKTVAKVSPRFGTPYVAILATGALMVILTVFLDLKQSAAITSFALLLTHVTVNLSAIILRRKKPNLAKFKVPLYPLIPVLGVCSCIILMFSLPVEAWIVSAVVVVISVGLYKIVVARKAASI